MISSCEEIKSQQQSAIAKKERIKSIFISKSLISVYFWQTAGPAAAWLVSSIPSEWECKFRVWFCGSASWRADGHREKTIDITTSCT